MCTPPMSIAMIVATAVGAAVSNATAQVGFVEDFDGSRYNLNFAITQQFGGFGTELTGGNLVINRPQGNNGGRFVMFADWQLIGDFIIQAEYDRVQTVSSDFFLQASPDGISATGFTTVSLQDQNGARANITINGGNSFNSIGFSDNSATLRIQRIGNSLFYSISPDQGASPQFTQILSGTNAAYGGPFTPVIQVNGGGLSGVFDDSETTYRVRAINIQADQFSGFTTDAEFADFNNDGDPDFFDVIDYLAELDGSGPGADFNRDRVVDVRDPQTLIEVVAAADD